MTTRNLGPLGTIGNGIEVTVTFTLEQADAIIELLADNIITMEDDNDHGYWSRELRIRRAAVAELRKVRSIAFRDHYLGE